MGPNAVTTNFTEDRVEGARFTAGKLDLDLTEDEAIEVIGSRVEDAENFWNARYELDSVRENNEKYWLNHSLQEDRLYEFQVPYKDNRIFTSVESVIPMVLSRPASPLITQAHDTDSSYELAQNLQKILLAKYEDLYLKHKFEMIARHLLVGKRIAYLKYRWDNTLGHLKKDGTRSGDVAVDWVLPEKVVIDKEATYKRRIPLIGEYMSASVEELAFKFPKKRDEIMQQALGENGNGQVPMTKQMGYVETWFSYLDKKTGEQKEGLAWKMKPVLMGMMKNPNWNYEETRVDADGKTHYNNYFDRPYKPYVVFNHLNLGRYVIDETSLLEQAAPLQDILDKRGRQATENADQANAGTIFNGDMISQEDVARLIGDPGEKVVVKGDVRAAAMRLPQNMLPEYVIDDKMDARNEIDNIFGTHDPIRGEQSDNKTLGQDVLSQRSDLSRITTLATAIEDGADQLYKGLVQMFKVFYDEPRTIASSDPSGSVEFIPFSQDSIEVAEDRAIAVRVKSGSVLPDDPIARQQETIQLAALLDPLSLGEGLNKEDPKEWAKRLFYMRVAPDKYAQDILGLDLEQGNMEPDAVNEMQQMMQGQQAPPQDNPSQNHLAQHQAMIASPQFKQLPPQVQQMMLEHAKAEAVNAKKALGQKPEEAPQPDNQQQPPPGTPGIVQKLMGLIPGRK